MVEQPAVRRRLRRFAKDVISFREAMIGGDFHVNDTQRSQGMDSGLPGEPCIPLDPEQEFDLQALKHVKGMDRQVSRVATAFTSFGPDKIGTRGSLLQRLTRSADLGNKGTNAESHFTIPISRDLLCPK